jgi:hypothetical protein
MHTLINAFFHIVYIDTNIHIHRARIHISIDVPIHTHTHTHTQAPLYKTNLRAGVLNTTGQSTNYILDVGIPTDENPRVWVLMATALVCMTND